MPQLDPDLRALQDVRDALGRALAAKEAIAHYDQEATDRLCQAMADVADSALSAGIEIQRRISIIQQDSTDDLAELYKDPWHAFAPEEDPATLTRYRRRRILESISHWRIRSSIGMPGSSSGM